MWHLAGYFSTGVAQRRRGQREDTVVACVRVRRIGTDEFFELM
jgi:hypothetical protein